MHSIVDLYSGLWDVVCIKYGASRDSPLFGVWLFINSFFFRVRLFHYRRQPVVVVDLSHATLSRELKSQRKVVFAESLSASNNLCIETVTTILCFSVCISLPPSRPFSSHFAFFIIFYPCSVFIRALIVFHFILCFFSVAHRVHRYADTQYSALISFIRINNLKINLFAARAIHCFLCARVFWVACSVLTAHQRSRSAAPQCKLSCCRICLSVLHAFPLSNFISFIRFYLIVAFPHFFLFDTLPGSEWRTLLYAPCCM